MNELDLKALGVTGINQRLYKVPKESNERHWVITNPMGQHAIACGLTAEFAGFVGAVAVSYLFWG